MHYGPVIATFITSLLITMLAIPSIVTVAKTKRLFDRPEGRRAAKKKVPTLGGLAIFAGLIISLSLFARPTLLPEFPYLIAGSVLLFFIGIKDDILIIAPWWKLGGQVLAAAGITILGGLRIEHMYGFPGIYEFSTPVSVLISILIIVFVINSFNLIDGIDGLAAGIGILSSALFGILFYHAGLFSWAIMAAALCGALTGFARYNVWGGSNKIFMGDTGSLLLGFFQAIMLVRFINIEYPSVVGVNIFAPVAFTFAILIIPVFDMVRVVVIRLIQSRSPFRPDRQHIHYQLVDVGLSHVQVTGILVAINVALILIAFFGGGLGELPLLLILLATATLLSVIPGIILKRKRNNQASPE